MIKLSDTILSEEKDTLLNDNYYDNKDIKTIKTESFINTEYNEIEENGDWKETPSPNIEKPVVRVFDVAAYILKKKGLMSTMKLQKLVYYSQAWSLVWDEKPLFQENIEAWANGPVVRDLFDYHRGRYQIDTIEIGNSQLLNQEQRDTVDVILNDYGDQSAQWLSELTHHEDPWMNARKGLPPLERGNRIISLDSMADYYSSLLVENSIENAEKE